MPTRHIAQFNPFRGTQSGAVLFVMLVILVIGAAALLVSALNSSSVKNARDKVTADALAKAKEALIGRAVADGNSPGSLPCPDTNNDGSADLFSGTNCPNYIGRLPWKTLGLSDDLRDGSGERLWYALSPNFRDYTSVNPINSNSQGNLTVSGTTTASHVIAIVFAPGAVVNVQSRSVTNTINCTTSGTSVAESLCATNYLEGSNAYPNTATSPNLSYQTAAASSTFNDQLLPIMASDLMPLVEARVAKKLTNLFALWLPNHSNLYPYPAKFNACTSSSCPSDTTTPSCTGKIPATDMMAALPGVFPTWFIPNNWFDVIYYSASTNVLPGGGGVGGTGNKGKGKGGRGIGGLSGVGGGGGGGGGTAGTGFGCYTSLSVSGISANALLLMPGTPLGTQSRTGSLSATPTNNLPQYFEDSENTNLDNIYVIPSTTSNDTLYTMP